MPLSIRQLAGEEVERLRPILGALPSGLWGCLPGSSEKQIEECRLDELRDLVAAPTTAAFVAESAGTILGFASVSESPWDSEVLGRHMGSLRQGGAPGVRDEVMDQLLATTVAHAAARGLECLTGRVDTKDVSSIHSLERNGFLLMDTLLDFFCDLRPGRIEPQSPSVSSEGIVIREAGPEDTEALLVLARSAFDGHFGRFHADPRIPREHATKVYEKWVLACLQGWAQLCLVICCHGVVAGFAAWRSPSALERKHELNLAHFTIALVHPDYAGRGLFGLLAKESMLRMSQMAVGGELPTHINNYPVQRGALKLGWRISGARHAFHRWLV